MTVDQLRKGIEALPPSAYEDMTYYERWISSVANTLLERGCSPLKSWVQKCRRFGNAIPMV